MLIAIKKGNFYNLNLRIVSSVDTILLSWIKENYEKFLDDSLFRFIRKIISTIF